jgi:acyl-CoA oxidase
MAFSTNAVSFLHRFMENRGDKYNSLPLQRCQPLVDAIGYRLAYEAALNAGVSSEFLELFTLGVIMQDMSWFTQHLKLSREDIFQQEARVLTKALPTLKKHLADIHIEPYCTAPIPSQDSMNSFVHGLETRGEH